MNLNYVVDVFSRLHVIKRPKIKVTSTQMPNAVCYLSLCMDRPLILWKKNKPHPNKSCVACPSAQASLYILG